MSTLSGGQKSRVAFAQIMWQKPHLLLLDEPTNHLDLNAVEALIDALLNFDGGLLVISHDEHLVSSICEELWVASPGGVRVFKDTFAEYRRQQLKLTSRTECRCGGGWIGFTTAHNRCSRRSCRS